MTYEDMHDLEMFLREMSEMPHGKDGEHYRHSLSDMAHDEALRLLAMYTVIQPFRAENEPVDRAGNPSTWRDR